MASGKPIICLIPSATRPNRGISRAGSFSVDPDSLGKFVAVLETPRANWFLLDSNNPPDGTAGRLGKAQLDWVAKELDARPDRPAIQSSEPLNPPRIEAVPYPASCTSLCS